MKGGKNGTKKDEATEVAPSLMFSQRNNPYCELLQKTCAAKIGIFLIMQEVFEKISNFDEVFFGFDNEIIMIL